MMNDEEELLRLFFKFLLKPHKIVKRGPKDTDESSDTYDTIEWLLKNIPTWNEYMEHGDYDL